MLYDIDSRVELADGDKETIIGAVEAVLYSEGITADGEISISIVSSEEIKKLNKDYRGIDFTTDVLSFPQYLNMEEMLLDQYIVFGDIVINIDKVLEQAKEYGTGRKRELSYLTIHSMYHLLGYDHVDDDEKKEMRKKEEIAYAYLEGK